MNMLFILPDELTRRALACRGGKVRTPSLDRLAREGVRCSSACSSACSSMVMLFTGATTIRDVILFPTMRLE